MEIPNLGKVTKDKELGSYTSRPIPVAMLGGKLCRFVVDEYDEDPNKDEFHKAIANFLSASPAVIKKAEKDIFRYYKDCMEFWDPEGRLRIKSPSDVWAHIHFGDEPVVSRRWYGDKGIYISLGCGCDWEKEHGLVIVFKNGLKVNKIGQYDGHLTNSDAYDDPKLENVVYHSV